MKMSGDKLYDDKADNPAASWRDWVNTTMGQADVIVNVFAIAALTRHISGDKRHLVLACARIT
jgi:hypothetical protein